MTETDAEAPEPRSIRFAPGDAVAIVGRDAICLVLDDPSSDLVAQLRANLLEGDGAESPLEVMVRTGGLDLPPFGLVVVDGDQVRVVVRGSVGATIRCADDAVDVLGERVRTWLEHVAEGVQSIRLVAEWSGSSSGVVPAFEIATGVVPAAVLDIVVAEASGVDGSDAVRIGLGSTDDLPGGGGASDAGEVPDVGLPVLTDGAAEADAVLPPPFHDPGQSSFLGLDGGVDEPHVEDPVELTGFEPEAPVWMSEASDAEPVDHEVVDHEVVDRETAPDAVDPGSGDAEASDPESPAATEGDDPSVEGPAEDLQAAFDHGATLIGPFDHLDGADDVEELDGEVLHPTPTPVHGAPTPVPGGPIDHADPFGSSGGGGAESDSDDDYDHLFGATQFRTVEQAAVRPEEDLDHDHVEGGQPGFDQALGDPGSAMISAIPGNGPAVGSLPGGWSGPAADDGDHDGRTVSLASLRAQLEGSSSLPGTSPAVHAVHCPRGHVNPIHAGRCRVCGDPIEDQEHVSIPRPVLGNLMFTDGRVIEVSRPLLIGRSPKADGALAGEPPELVVVPSPLKEISSTHLELRLEGWQVLVVDRQSTNGTVVIAPGRDPQRLRPGEPVPITPGTRVNLADETEFVFEVAQ